MGLGKRTIVQDTQTLKVDEKSGQEIAYIRPRVKMTERDYDILVKLAEKEEKRTGVKIVIVPASVDLVEEPK